MLTITGYSSVQEVATISIEDLEDTGFYRLGHQKRLTLGIRKLKDLSRGGGGGTRTQQDYYQQGGHHPQYIAQSTEIPLQSAPLAAKPGAFSSFSSPYPTRKIISVETHHQQHPQHHQQQPQQQLHYQPDRYCPEQQQQYNRYCQMQLFEEMFFSEKDFCQTIHFFLLLDCCFRQGQMVS